MTPADIRGQALGLHSAGMFTMQAVGATMAGAVAQYTTASGAMVVMAVLSIIASLLLTSGLRAGRGTGSATPVSPGADLR